MPPVRRPARLWMHTAQRILSDIERLGLGEGDRLPSEDELLAEYDVGRGTLRESIRLLELHGLVTVRQGRNGGVIVKSPEPTDLSEILKLTLHAVEAPYSSVVELRTMLEPLVARLAATRMNDAAVEESGELLEQMARAVDDRLAFVRANAAFSALMVRCVDNPLLSLVAAALSQMINEKFPGGGNLTWDPRAVLTARRELHRALAAGDADAAAALAAQYIAEYNRHVTATYYDELQDRVAW